MKKSVEFEVSLHEIDNLMQDQGRCLHESQRKTL